MNQTNRHYRKPIFMLVFASLILISVVACQTDLFLPTQEADTLLTAESMSQDIIEPLQARLVANPDDARAYTELGLAFAQDARLHDDLALYALAEEAFLNALERDANDVDAMMGMGVVALTRHDFASALEWATQARELNPFRAQIVGIMVDANVELGRYDEAVQLAQEMVNLRPDIHAYTRISFLREIYGEAQGAIDAMQAAVDAGMPGSEPWLWAQVWVGNLYFESGDLEQATQAYEAALALRSDYNNALAGLATIDAAQGDYDRAIATYEAIVQSVSSSEMTSGSLPGYLESLGELYELIGQPEKAEAQYTLIVEAERQLGKVGVNVDVDLAIFESTRNGDWGAAVEQARIAYEASPTIFAADTLAWMLYENGEYEEAWDYIQEALRFGIQEAPFYYHAGMIAYALGNKEESENHLRTALSINPYFSPTDAPIAKELLDSL